MYIEHNFNLCRVQKMKTDRGCACVTVNNEDPLMSLHDPVLLCMLLLHAVTLSIMQLSFINCVK